MNDVIIYNFPNEKSYKPSLKFYTPASDKKPIKNPILNF